MLCSFLFLSNNNLLSQIFYMSDSVNYTTEYTCSSVIYDNGGENASYLNNTDVIRTFCSTNGSLKISVDFLNLQSGSDFLYVYDGSSTSDPLLASLTGFDQSGSSIYTSSGACLTLRFTSDGSVAQQNSSFDGGFTALMSCAPFCGAGASASDDCSLAPLMIGANEYCGATNNWFTIDEQSIDGLSGNGEFCGSIENNSWLQFTASDTVAVLQVNTNCLNGYGIQMGVFSGSCGSLTRVDTNCFNPISGNVVKLTGLSIGETYHIMFDGNAGDYCDYLVSFISGNSYGSIDIKDDKDRVGSSNYCANECGVFSIKNNSAGNITSYNWYSNPAGISGVDSVLNYCPNSNMKIYCDVMISNGTIFTDSFEITLTPITFMGLPSTIACNDSPVTIYSPYEVTPCYYVEFMSNAETSARTINMLEGIVNVGSYTFYDSHNSHSITFPQLSPSQNHSLQLIGNNGAGMPFKVKDCSNDSLIYSGIWGTDSIHAISSAGNLPNGISNFSTSCSNTLTSTDWGIATFDPSLINGPFPKSCSITYHWNNNNGCVGSATNNITITSPYVGYSYTNNGNGNYFFTNNSSSSFNQSHWAFGDGTTSTQTNPTHSFNANGTYVVVLTENDSTGSVCSGYYLDTIMVTGVQNPSQCVAGFVVYPDSSTDNLIVINSAIGNNLTYLWDFGDGTTSTLMTPTHVYSDSGPYYLCLTIDDGNGCINTYCDSVDVNGVVFGKQTGFTINIVALPVVTQLIEIKSFDREIKVYPNPASDGVVLEMNNFSPKTLVSIVSIDGKELYTNKSINNNKLNIDVNNWSRGVYFIKIIDGDTLITKKLLLK